MTDAFENVDQASPEFQAMLVSFLERRGADPARRAILESYLAEIAFPPAARVLDVGCGTGAVTRTLAQWTNVGEVIGIEPWVTFLDKARELGIGIANLSFQQADGHELPFEDGSFDAVIFHTTLFHMHDPVTALAEAHRVLRVGGWLSVLDPDPIAHTFAIADHDPLQAVYEASITRQFMNPWLPRRFPAFITAAGFTVNRVRSYGNVAIEDSPGTLTFFDVSVDIVVDSGVIGEDLGAAFKAEARRRIEAGTFVWFSTMVSVVARKAG